MLAVLTVYGWTSRPDWLAVSAGSIGGDRGVRQATAGAPRARSRRWTPSKAQLRWRLQLLFAVTDAGVLALAHAGAGALRFGDPLDATAMTLAAATVPLFAAAAFGVNGYSTVVLIAPRQAIRRGLKALGLALAGTLFFLFLLQRGAAISRFTFAAAALFAMIGVAGGRWFLGRNAAAILGGNPYDVVVIQDGESILPAGSCTVFVDAAGLDPARQNPAMFDRLGKLAEGADRVIVACPPERRLLWASALQGANVQGEVMAPELSGVGPVGIEAHGGVPTLIVARAPLLLRDRVLKRGFDVGVAGTALVLLAPLMATIAIAIRCADGGPALFRQSRLGRRNRPFEILKFRTMRVAAADLAGARSATRDDERVTALGRVLRRWSLDELPQLLNVLRGEMSIVGPRPHALASRAGDRLFWELDGRYWDRHAIKPGLTGLAQVRGLRGATAAGEDLTRRLRADLEYRERWSLWRDIAIVARTAPALLSRNAF